jgi:thioesterase domain-containing protein/NADP-dependent 3-hydroxy acid dehydrogenase YdfG/acyl carrier protein
MHSDENQMRVRPGVRETARLVLSSAVVQGASSAFKPAISAEASYLVTGGLGALGRVVARWLVLEQGARHVILVGRGQPTEAGQRLIDELCAAGAQIELPRVDVSDRAQLEAMLHDPAQTRPPLRGVFHLACVMDDATLLSQNAERFERVFAPKALGAWNLHLATRDMPLDHFVLFSSIAGVLGNPGQANYAAANSFLDALAVGRRAEGLPALSVAWGLWVDADAADSPAAGGARTLPRVDRARMAANGIRPIGPAFGMRALERALAENAAERIVMPLGAAGLQLSGAIPPLLRGFAHSTEAEERAVGPTFTERLAALPPSERAAMMQGELLALAARTLGLSDVSEVDPDRPLTELGLDSLMALSIRNNAAKLLGRWLPAGIVLDHPTPRALSDHLLNDTNFEAAAEPAPAPEPPKRAPMARRSRRTLSALRTNGSAPRQRKLEGPVSDVSIVQMRAAKPTLFLIPPGTGHSEAFLRFTPHLDKGMPVVGLQYNGRDHDRPGAFFRELAETFIVKMKEVQPSGPYYLLGYSAGGLLAFEMACQLHAAGESVAKLINLDGPGPDLITVVDSATRFDQEHLYTLDGARLAGITMTREDILAVSDQASAYSLIERRAREQGLPVARRDFEERINSSGVMRRGMAAYRADRRYPGTMTLLRVEDAMAEMPDRFRLGDLGRAWHAARDLGWSNWVGNLEVRPVPGGHISVVFDPHVSVVASIVRELVA